MLGRTLGARGVLIARWNGSLLPSGRNTMSPHALQMRIPMTSMHIDLVLKAGVPTVISEDWLSSTDFLVKPTSMLLMSRISVEQPHLVFSLMVA